MRRKIGWTVLAVVAIAAAGFGAYQLSADGGDDDAADLTQANRLPDDLDWCVGDILDPPYLFAPAYVLTTVGELGQPTTLVNALDFLTAFYQESAEAVDEDPWHDRETLGMLVGPADWAGIAFPDDPVDGTETDLFEEPDVLLFKIGTWDQLASQDDDAEVLLHLVDPTLPVPADFADEVAGATWSLASAWILDSQNARSVGACYGQNLDEYLVSMAIHNQMSRREVLLALTNGELEPALPEPPPGPLTFGQRGPTGRTFYDVDVPNGMRSRLVELTVTIVGQPSAGAVVCVLGERALSTCADPGAAEFTALVEKHHDAEVFVATPFLLPPDEYAGLDFDAQKQVRTAYTAAVAQRLAGRTFAVPAGSEPLVLTVSIEGGGRPVLDAGPAPGG